ncbi:MAG: YcjF family protein [Candidatus Udaeobacter sp.]
MNQKALLRIAEKLERLVGRLPSKIRNAVLRELTPLKELFLQQRPPRFLFIGSSKMPTHTIINTLFTPGAQKKMNVALMPVHRWIDWNISGHGTISILDARDAGDSAAAQVEEDLRRQPADVIFLFDDGESNLARPSAPNFMLHLQDDLGGALDDAKVIGVSFGSERRVVQLEEALKTQPGIRDRLLKVIQFTEMHSAETRGLLSVLAAELPNEAKIEMIRISRDREAQHHVAQMLIKSTTAICTAIGAQPIPLADLPILTSLQVMMVSGIMYISGRERSLRAATEFITALGANVGAGMLLREGARAILKFFPGWGNVVCGMVAGAGTYAIGRAATAFFIGGVSLRDARRKYLADRKKASHKSYWSHGSLGGSKSIE